MQFAEYMFPILVIIYTSTLVIFSIQSNKKSGENKRIDKLNKYEYL